MLIFISCIAIIKLSAGSPVFDAELKKKNKKSMESRAKSLMKNQPVEFLENKGQFLDMNGKPASFLLFKAEAPGVDLYITEKGLSYVFLHIVCVNQQCTFSASGVSSYTGIPDLGRPCFPLCPQLPHQSLLQ